MRKVVVFDSGWGGELVANYIEYELAVIEVIRVIDWRNAPYAGKTRVEILQCVEEGLRPYWRRVDAVVLAGFMASLVVDALRRRHPGVKFVEFSMGEWKMTGRVVKRMMILADGRIRGLPEYRELRWLAEARAREVVEPDCAGWVEMIDEGEMSREFLEGELRSCLETGKVDKVIVANTHFWDIERDLTSVLGWQVQVIDQREELLRRLCRALRLRGVDGRRRR